MKTRFWVVYAILVLFSVFLGCKAFGQVKPVVPAKASSEEKAPQLTDAEIEHMGKLYTKMSYAEAEVREYAADLQAKRPGWVLQEKYGGVFEFVKKQGPPPAMGPAGLKAVVPETKGGVKP